MLLVAPDEPDNAGQRAAELAGQAADRTAYGRDVPVQLVWRTLDEFRYNRCYTNSVATNAIRECIIVPRNPENYRAANYEDDKTECQPDWSEYDTCLEQAADHLDAFRALTELGISDTVIGQQTQNALEHGLKALLAAPSVGYDRNYSSTHNIGLLLGNVRYRDPEIRVSSYKSNRTSTPNTPDGRATSQRGATPG